MGDFLLDLIGQSADKQLEGETSKYNPRKGTIERSDNEKWWDERFGRTGAIQQGAKDSYVDEISDGKIADSIVMHGGTPEITARTTKAELLKQAAAAKKDYDKANRDATYDENYNRPDAITARGNLEADRARVIARDKEGDRRYYDSKREALQLRKDERLDRVDQRMSDREVRMLELGMQERMFDKRLQSDARADKKQRMAAIIAGLANLGGAFAI